MTRAFCNTPLQRQPGLLQRKEQSNREKEPQLKGVIDWTHAKTMLSFRFISFYADAPSRTDYDYVLQPTGN